MRNPGDCLSTPPGRPRLSRRPSHLPAKLRLAPQGAGMARQFLGTSLNWWRCAKPSVVYQYACDQLPAGYIIAPKTSVDPEPYCPSHMTQSACALSEQTFSNGVCDPNETVWTSPIDCGCTGAPIVDAY